MVDLDERRRRRHARVRQLSKKVRSLRRAERRARLGGRLGRGLRNGLTAGLIVATIGVAMWLVPQLTSDEADGGDGARTRARAEIEDIADDLVADVERTTRTRARLDAATVLEADTTIVNGWSLPLARIDADRAARPHHTYAAWDYGTRTGTEVLAMTGGTIISATPDDGARCGGTIVLSTADEGARITYCHLSAVAVARGDVVTAGQTLGRTGGQPGTEGAGRSSGPHLHLQITLDGTLHCPQAQLVALAAGRSLRVEELPTTNCWYESTSPSFFEPSGAGGTSAEQAPPDERDVLAIWD